MIDPSGFNLADNRQFVTFSVLAVLSILATLVMAAVTFLGARGARNAAQEAAQYAKPTGNGFAKEVTQSLSRIELDLLRIENKVDHHLQSHADKEIADHERIFP